MTRELYSLKIMAGGADLRGHWQLAQIRTALRLNLHQGPVWFPAAARTKESEKWWLSNDLAQIHMQIKTGADTESVPKRGTLTE